MSPFPAEMQPLAMSDQAEVLILVVTTTETRADADRLAGELVERNLAACAQLEGPIHSHYRWAGQSRVSAEYRLVLKSRLSLWAALREKLAELHPYEEPEIVMTRIDDASEGFRAWVIEQTS